MKRQLLRMMGCAMILACAGHAEAVVTYSMSDGAIHETTQISTHDTWGDMMGGMVVTVGFADGTQDSSAWVDVGLGFGGAAGNGWSWTVSEWGHTFTGQWTLSNDSGMMMDWIMLYGAPGDTVFDVVMSPEGTPNSSSGRALEVVEGPQDVTVSYTDIVRLKDDLNSPYGDLYARMTIEFDNGLANEGEFVYRQDTDNAAVAGDIKRVPDGGMTAALLGLALVGMGIVARRLR